MITHVGFEGPDALGSILAEAGFELRYLEACIDPVDSGHARDAELLVIMGGPIGAYEEQQYPFLTDELRLLEARLREDRLNLGICLSAQLIARALGADVFPGEAGKEIGWAPISTPSASPLLSAMADGPVLHWHGDTFDLPVGAELLASTARYPHQAFQYGASVLAFQFHPEVTPLGLNAGGSDTPSR